jgi:hypothetical protein
MLRSNRSVVARSAPMLFSSCAVDRKPRAERGSTSIFWSVLFWRHSLIAFHISSPHGKFPRRAENTCSLDCELLSFQRMPSCYWITTSATESSGGGMLRPIALTVVRLTTRRAWPTGFLLYGLGVVPFISSFAFCSSTSFRSFSIFFFFERSSQFFVVSNFLRPLRANPTWGGRRFPSCRHARRSIVCGS